MRVIGITGGIGVGKSFILRQIAEAGYPTYSADLRAKELMETDPVLQGEIRSLFGAEAYTADGHLNRALIAQRIFAEPALRQRLNALVHPRTMADFAEWVQHHAAAGASAVFKEAAITVEVGAWKGLDALMLVYAPLRVRIKRLVARDQLSEAQILSRLRAQWPEWRKLPYADFFLINDGVLPIYPQLRSFFNKYDLPFPNTFA